MQMRWPLCGTKLSLCCSIISVWGIVQFILLGVFFYAQAGPLVEDFEFDADTKDEKVFEDRLKDAYNQRAYNCWIAAFLYVGLLVFAGSQFMINQKNSSATTISSPFPAPVIAGGGEENGLHQQYGMQYQNE